MRADALKDALKLAEGRPVFAATAVARRPAPPGLRRPVGGRPSGARIGDRVVLPPPTLDNVGLNPRVALVVWDEAADAGYQVAR